MNSSTGTSRQPVKSIVTQDAVCQQYQDCVVVFVYSDYKWYFVCLLTVNDYRAVVFIFLGISVAVGLWRVAAALVVRKTSGKTRQTPQMKNNLAIKVIILTITTTCLDIDKKRCVVYNLCSRLPGFLQNNQS